MIFISHNSKDKDFVGPIATSLSEKYGKDNVFFDSWSIKPGENIITRMSEGLEKCKFFFFFITENSLDSEMVTLEWTAALKERGRKDILFIPIRAEKVEVPMIISALNYLDLTTLGTEATLAQMDDLIRNEDLAPNFPTYQNLEGYFWQEDAQTINFSIYAKKFFEPSGKFLFVTNLGEAELKLEYLSSSISESSFNPNAANLNGKKLNAFMIGTDYGVKVGFKVEIKLSLLTRPYETLDVFHIKSAEEFPVLPLRYISSPDELPKI